MKKFIFILLASFSLINFTLSQPNEDWVARYDGPGSDFDESYAVVVDGSGNVYVTGYSIGNGTGEDFTTIKYNSSGTQQWVSRYDGPGGSDDEANAIALDGSGNVYVTGYSIGNGTGPDITTIKYNSSGAQQWVVGYDGPAGSSDVAFSMAVDGSGNVYVTGWSTGSGTGYDCTTIKYNTSGTQQWVARFDGAANGSDIAHSIAVDGSGNVYITGLTSSSSVGGGPNYNYITIKYNSSGSQQWASEYDGSSNDYDEAFSLAVDGSGNVFVTGYCTSNGLFTPGFDYATVKYNSSGTQQWATTYDGGGSDVARALVIDGSSNVYITGYSAGSGGRDYATVKYNSSGTQQWASRYDGPVNLDDFAFAIAIDGSGNVYVTGGSRGNETEYDYATLKYNSSGSQQWEARYDYSVHRTDVALSLAVDASNNVYVTGYSNSTSAPNYNMDFATIKYSQDGDALPFTVGQPIQYGLSQNYPNPFNPKTVINFQIANLSNVKIAVYDIEGSEIEVLLNKRLEQGTYNIEWDGSLYSSGIYFYKLTSDNYSETRKMILVK